MNHVEPLLGAQELGPADAGVCDEFRARALRVALAAAGACQSGGRYLAERYYGAQWAVIGRLFGDDALRERVEAIESYSHVMPFLSIADPCYPHRQDILDMVSTIGEIPVEDRDTVIGSVLRVARPDMEPRIRGRLIAVIAALQEGNRVHFIRYLRRQEDGIVDEVITRVHRVLRQQGPQVMNALAEQAQLEPELFRMVEPLNEVGGNGRAAAARGINVHHGERDRQTREAIELLRQEQGPLSDKQIEQANREFVKYLDSSDVDAAQRELANNALLAEREEEEQFGPLVGGPVFTVLGLEVSGEELVARVWMFASDHEPNNTKRGMVLALADSYEHQERVCNQGKAHRLVIAVLQGRLAGVNIEGEVSEVSVPQALTMFFHLPGHRDLAEEPLFAAADKFCAENSAVPKEAFLKAVQDYAENQGN